MLLANVTPISIFVALLRWLFIELVTDYFTTYNPITFVHQQMNQAPGDALFIKWSSKFNV
jgi:ABC-type uncharacterized transport system permease subunit